MCFFLNYRLNFATEMKISGMPTTQESPTWETNNTSFRMNATVAVEPDSSSSPSASSLTSVAKLRQIENCIANIHITKWKTGCFTYKRSNFLSVSSKAFAKAAFITSKSPPFNSRPPCKAATQSLYSSSLLQHHLHQYNCQSHYDFCVVIKLGKSSFQQSFLCHDD